MMKSVQYGVRNNSAWSVETMPLALQTQAGIWQGAGDFGSSTAQSGAVVRVVRVDLSGGIDGVLSLCSAAIGGNSDYGRGQYFDLNRLISAAAATMASSPTTPKADVINRTGLTSLVW